MIKSEDQLAAEMRRLRRLNHALIKHARAGEIDEVHECLKEGEINFKDAYGWTALLWATYRNDKEMVALLVEKGATSTIKDNQDWPALCMAATLGFFEVAEILLTDRVANINIKGNGELTPLMMASAVGNLDMVQLLLKKKARPNQQSSRGLTALMKACEKGHLPVIITLLFYGASIAIKDKDGKTAMNWARRRQHTVIVDLLKDWPGVPSIKRVGLSPLDWAKENLKEEVVELLEDWKEQATPKCTTDMRKVQTGNTVTDLDCVWAEDLAGGDSCDECQRHGLRRAWYGQSLGVYLCEFCLQKPAEAS